MILIFESNSEVSERLNLMIDNMQIIFQLRRAKMMHTIMLIQIRIHTWQVHLMLKQRLVIIRM